MFIPPEFAHRGHLWWRSQLSRFLWRPKPFVLGYVDERQASMGWGGVGGREGGSGASHVVGLHVRHGDKSWDVEHQGSYFGGLGRYLAKSDALLSKRGNPPPRYFVSTDDQAVIEEAKFMGLDAMWDDSEPRYNGTHVYSPPGVSEKRCAHPLPPPPRPLSSSLPHPCCTPEPTIQVSRIGYQKV
jgi:hypothetical protein